VPIALTSACRVITYGHDEVLLSTRRAILETAGFKSDTARSAEALLECLTSGEWQYNIMVVCHTVPADEQQIIVEAAKGSDVQVYVLTGFVQPQHFIEHIQELSKRC
jgi:DNA-binding response OmpR family regulator